MFCQYCLNVRNLYACRTLADIKTIMNTQQICILSSESKSILPALHLLRAWWCSFQDFWIAGKEHELWIDGHSLLLTWGSEPMVPLHPPCQTQCDYCPSYSSGLWLLLSAAVVCHHSVTQKKTVSWNCIKSTHSNKKIQLVNYSTT